MATDKAPFAPRGNIVGQGWPSFRTGPNGERQIFNSPDEVPEGWHDGASAPKFAEPPKAPPHPALLPAGHEFVAVPHDVAAAIRGGKFHTNISVGGNPAPLPVVTPAEPQVPRRLARTRGAFRPDEAAE